MTMGISFGITMFFVGLVLVVPALWLGLAGFWPGALDRAEDRIRRRPWATFFTGVGSVALFLGLVAGLSAAAPALGLVAGSLGIVWSFVGMSALARIVGRRLASPAWSAWRTHVAGAAVLALALFVPPIPGWILLLPLSVILGAGATTLSLFGRRPAADAPAPAASEAKEQEKVLA